MDWGSCAQTVFNKTTYTVASLSCLPYLFSNILDASLLFAGSVALIIIMVSGIRLIIAQGDAKQLEQVKNILTYAIIGFIIILFSFLLLNIIEKVTGVTCLAWFSPFTSNNCTGAVTQ